MRLIIQTGTQASQSFELNQDLVTIGRGAGNTIPLTDPYASRNHAQIQRTTQGFVIQDLGSGNGTRVNDIRIVSPQLLNVGDSIGIGQTTFAVAESIVATEALGPSTIGAASLPPQRSGLSGTQWALIGGIIGAFVLLALLFYFLTPGLGAPTPTPVAILPTSTAAPPRVLAPTRVPPTSAPLIASPTPLVPEATATTGANVESTFTPTFTPTYTPTFTPTFTPTHTPTYTPTRTNTPRPTNTPTRTPTKLYAEPIILQPSNNAKFTLNDEITMVWSSATPLRDRDFYKVTVSRDPNFQDVACVVYAQEARATIGGGNCNSRWEFNNIYWWHLQVIVRDASGNETLISPVGRTFQFGWQP